MNGDHDAKIWNIVDKEILINMDRILKCNLEVS